MMPGPARQRGVAVLTAMLVVMLATLLAVNLAWETSLDLRRTENMLMQDQAHEYAEGAAAWAADILEEDARTQSANVDHPGENWAQRLPPLLVEGGALEGFLEDAQGRFDLNSLIDPVSGAKNEPAFAQFQRLLSALALDPDLADAVLDWLDPDQSPELQGAEDDRYTSRIPPYRAANFWFTSTTELLAVEGFDLEQFNLLSPHVTALPPSPTGEPHLININTATPAVLRSLGENLSEVDAEQLAANRPYDQVEDLETLIDPALLARVGVASGYFRLVVTVSIGTTRVTLYSLLERGGQSVQVRLRTYNTI